MDVRQCFDGTWGVWDGSTLLVGGLTNSAAWAELDRRTTRANYKSSSCQFRDLGSWSTGAITPWTNPKARKKQHAKRNKKKMWRRAPLIRRRTP
jgi:hypothetical protein